jgi:DNA-binding transcriptional MerR regulator
MNKSTKSNEAFRTISEVAEDLDLPQHVLRFWETKFSQVRPLKRGGGRRYYRPEDVALLRHIRSLLYDEGYTIKGVQKLLRQDGPSKSELREMEVAREDPPAPDSGMGADERSVIVAAIDELEALRRQLAETSRAN